MCRILYSVLIKNLETAVVCRDLIKSQWKTACLERGRLLTSSLNLLKVKAMRMEGKNV